MIGVVGRETDYGTANADGRAVGRVPVVFYEVEVHESLVGPVDDTIIVGRLDASKM